MCVTSLSHQPGQQAKFHPIDGMRGRFPQLSELAGSRVVRQWLRDLPNGIHGSLDNSNPPRIRPWDALVQHDDSGPNIRGSGAPLLVIEIWHLDSASSISTAKRANRRENYSRFSSIYIEIESRPQQGTRSRTKQKHLCYCRHLHPVILLWLTTLTTVSGWESFLSCTREGLQAAKVASSGIEEIEVDVDLPYPIARCVVYVVSIASHNPFYWAKFIVGAFFDDEGTNLWEIKILIADRHPRLWWFEEDSASETSEDSVHRAPTAEELNEQHRRLVGDSIFDYLTDFDLEEPSHGFPPPGVPLYVEEEEAEYYRQPPSTPPSLPLHSYSSRLTYNAHRERDWPEEERRTSNPSERRYSFHPHHGWGWQRYVWQPHHGGWVWEHEPSYQYPSYHY
ncbi:hypothetical protein B0H66DRAFT_531071 [Apodospora peruviana]|uniref:Uncharacterized protein n=1 Tax=Apodospora peruviana TaxID=516989 RepID=A0AAE0IAZ2_9PEZI|nr:hypothetical protein B0H66DRAFT_531071 [Apodospora peruviana]